MNSQQSEAIAALHASLRELHGSTAGMNDAVGDIHRMVAAQQQAHAQAAAAQQAPPPLQPPPQQQQTPAFAAADAVAASPEQRLQPWQYDETQPAWEDSPLLPAPQEHPNGWRTKRGGASKPAQPRAPLKRQPSSRAPLLATAGMPVAAAAAAGAVAAGAAAARPPARKERRRSGEQAGGAPAAGASEAAVKAALAARVAAAAPAPDAKPVVQPRVTRARAALAGATKTACSTLPDRLSAGGAIAFSHRKREAAAAGRTPAKAAAAAAAAPWPAADTQTNAASRARTATGKPVAPKSLAQPAAARPPAQPATPAASFESSAVPSGRSGRSNLDGWLSRKRCRSPPPRPASAAEGAGEHVPQGPPPVRFVLLICSDTVHGVIAASRL